MIKNKTSSLPDSDKPDSKFLDRMFSSTFAAPAAAGSPDVAGLPPRVSVRQISDGVLTPPNPLTPKPLSDSVLEVITNGAFSKTWVLPPRKKPGRKAANDAPPTVLFITLRVR